MPELPLHHEWHGKSDASRPPLLIVPGNHGDYLGELAAAGGDSGPLERTLPFIADFLGTLNPR